jgi:hypothetical protein
MYEPKRLHIKFAATMFDFVMLGAARPRQITICAMPGRPLRLDNVNSL